MNQQRIRVMQVIPAFNLGGGEWMATYLAAHLNHNRFESHLLSLYPPRGAPQEAYLLQHRVIVHSLHKRKGFDLRAYPALIRLLREIRPDVVHTHQTVGRYVYPACLFSRPPLVVHTLHSVASGEIRSRFWRRFQNWAYRWGVHPVAIAEEVAQSFRQEYRREPIAIIPNGIPTAHYAADPQVRHQWRIKEGIPEDKVVLVCVAGLRPPKNHSLLLRAYARLRNILPQTVLLLVGPSDPTNPEYTESLKLLIQELGIVDHVRFLGARSDVTAILNAADIFILSSLYEGNPLSVMEAMAAGLPLICTAVGGIPELIQHYQTGLLVPPNDETALANAIEQLVIDSSLRTQLGHAAREYARAHFDVEQMARAYEQLYLALLRNST
jgi:glycosyltransferase involved in cell wall biosynthesis